MQILQYFRDNLYEVLHSSQCMTCFTDQNNIRDDTYTSQIRKNEYLRMRFANPGGHSGIMFAKEK